MSHVKFYKMFKKYIFRNSLSFFKRFCSESTYYFEMPECYQKSFYFANASFHDNVNWYYYRGIEVAFNKFIHKIRNVSPSTKDKVVIQSVLNKVSMMELCNYVMEINFPLRKDNGQVEIIRSYLAKHGVHYPIHLGGLRICETVEKSHMTGLAAIASFKHICADVPFAGSHAGIKINPGNYSDDELMRIASTFTRQITEKNFFGPHVNIIEPDLNCTSDLIDVMLEEFLRIKGNEDTKDLACITGKPLNNGGIHVFEESAADGIFYGLDKFINHHHYMYKIKTTVGWKKKTFIIKSLDKIGVHLIKQMIKEGTICVGVADDDCVYYNKAGIDIEGAIEYKKQHGSVKNFFPDYNKKKIFNEICDILIITDAHQKIDYHIAPTIQAKIIVEAAYGAITPTAHKILVGKSKLVIPDIYINSGSSVASYTEYVKNMESSIQAIHRESSKNLLLSQGPRAYISQHNTGFITYNPESTEEITSENDFLKPAIQMRMTRTAQDLIKIVKELKLENDLRIAAYVMASDKIFELLQHIKYV